MGRPGLPSHGAIDSAASDLSESNSRGKLLLGNAFNIQSLGLCNQQKILGVARMRFAHASVIDEFLESSSPNEETSSTNKRNPRVRFHHRRKNRNFIIKPKQKKQIHPFISTKLLTLSPQIPPTSIPSPNFTPKIPLPTNQSSPQTTPRNFQKRNSPNRTPNLRTPLKRARSPVERRARRAE